MISSKPAADGPLARPSRCPICSHSGKYRFTAHSFAIHECRHCHHSYTGETPAANHVECHYGDEYFNQGGAGYSDYLASEPLLRQHGERYAKLVTEKMSRSFQGPGSAFAVGAAAGFDLLGFQQRGWQVGGIEPNRSMTQFAAQKFQIALECGTLENHEVKDQFDVVLALQVVAHFFDIQQAAQKLALLVRPGGVLLIETWNYRSITAKLFGRAWHEYSPPTVLQWFSPRSLERWLNGVGFQLVAQGRPAKRITGQHAASLLKYKIESLPLGHWLSWPTRWIPPSLTLPYPAEDLFWALFQMTPEGVRKSESQGADDGSEGKS